MWVSLRNPARIKDFDVRPAYASEVFEYFHIRIKSVQNKAILIVRVRKETRIISKGNDRKRYQTSHFYLVNSNDLITFSVDFKNGVGTVYATDDSRRAGPELIEQHEEPFDRLFFILRPVADHIDPARSRFIEVQSICDPVMKLLRNKKRILFLQESMVRHRHRIAIQITPQRSECTITSIHRSTKAKGIEPVDYVGVFHVFSSWYREIGVAILILPLLLTTSTNIPMTLPTFTPETDRTSFILLASQRQLAFVTYESISNRRTASQPPFLIPLIFSKYYRDDDDIRFYFFYDTHF
ncbi:hypothetical protein FGO68_gene13094 [Halteria grandinella]|uniref:Uncharacterized protein n=1 Tax=Halteria grandinella TaxID=5974 RepID=A0A8J8SVB0_HALGN|nr:hypothetical protein FGO68_gene13094 [Halteria grandinella]